MRKLLYIFLCCVVLLNCVGCTATNDEANQTTLPTTTIPATEPVVYDSLNIPQKEDALVRENAKERIVRVLKASRSTLAEENAIEIIASESETAYYVVLEPVNDHSTELRVERKKIVDGASIEDEPYYINRVWRVFMQYSTEPHHFFDADVVEQVYCLQEYAPYMFTPLVYYCTTEGDYVLYFDYYAGLKLYLFPAEVYSSIERKLLTSDITLSPGAGGVRIDPAFVWDIEPYRIELPENFLQLCGIK